MDSSRPLSLRPLALLLVLAFGSRAHAQDIGAEGPSYVGAGSFPTGTKPQSKLWYHDGAWWGSLFSSTARVFRIHRLDPATEIWVDTGTTIDPRHTSHSDCLSDGNRLYVGTHHFQEQGFDGFPLRVYRFTYDSVQQKYSLDAGFPVQVANTSCEALVIDKDSTGTVWATWTQGLRVQVAHTLGSDLSWTTPFVLPVNTTDIDPDDIDSLVHFQGNRVGLLWSDQVGDAYYFSIHVDGASDGDWSVPEVVQGGPQQADDHLHLKAASDGRVFAVVKNALNETWVRERSTAGQWTGHLLSSPQDEWTRSIVLLDEVDGKLHAFGTAPILGGTIYHKVSRLDTVDFEPGLGEAFLQVAASPTLNDATSTKQAVTPTTGLALLASHQGSRHYWYRVLPLGKAGHVRHMPSFSDEPPSGALAPRMRFPRPSSLLGDDDS